jgi:hypothetical protein
MMSEKLLARLYQEKHEQQGKYFDLMIKHPYFRVSLLTRQLHNGEAQIGPGRYSSPQIKYLAEALRRREGSCLCRTPTAQAVKNHWLRFIHVLQRHRQQVQRQVSGTINDTPCDFAGRAHINQGERIPLFRQGFELIGGDFLKTVHASLVYMKEKLIDE